MNPRFVLWARSAGLDAGELLRRGELEGEVPRVDGMPWTVLFMVWISERWHTWAAELGYREQRAALADGHTHADFDAWLEVQR